MSELLHLEMKYCERCGTLGLRHEGSGEIYCAPCAREMARVYRAPSPLREAEGKKPCGAVGLSETTSGGAR